MSAEELNPMALADSVTTAQMAQSLRLSRTFPPMARARSSGPLFELRGFGPGIDALLDPDRDGYDLAVLPNLEDLYLEGGQFHSPEGAPRE
jgi:hypothetical protein